MTTQIRIVQFSEALRNGLFEFAKHVHPSGKNLTRRLEWFTCRNPLTGPQNSVHGLFAVTPSDDIVGQFLMSPFQFYFKNELSVGYFGYDFFVKEDYRSQGMGAFLFVQGVRKFQPFLGVGVTSPVENIAKAAGMRTAGLLKKFLWVQNPFAFGWHALQSRFMKGSAAFEEGAVPESAGPFQWSSSVPAGYRDISHQRDGIGLARSPEFLQWRFFDSPRPYHFYYSADRTAYFVVRKALYQGMRFLVMVDYRAATVDDEVLVFTSVKALARAFKADGVVAAATCAQTEGALVKAGFFAAGRPSPVIVSLPSHLPLQVALTMADADLDLSFGEPA